MVVFSQCDRGPCEKGVGRWCGGPGSWGTVPCTGRCQVWSLGRTRAGGGRSMFLSLSPFSQISKCILV